MSTIAPGRFFNVTDAASFVALSQQNWVIASEELFRRAPTHQNGSPNTLNGPPTAGAWNVGDFWRDQNGGEFACTGAGSPGTWRQIMPASVTADPASGTFPAGYLILNATGGGLKRHAGSLAWEAQVGAGPASKFGFHGAAPTTQRANADQAAGRSRQVGPGSPSGLGECLQQKWSLCTIATWVLLSTHGTQKLLSDRPHPLVGQDRGEKEREPAAKRLKRPTDRSPAFQRLLPRGLSAPEVLLRDGASSGSNWSDEP